MSSPRVQKIFEAMPDQLKRLGQYGFDLGSVIKWQGRDALGRDAMLLDIDSTTWADNNRRVIIVAVEASDKNNTVAMKTQSHASGHSMASSVKFLVYAETPEDHTGAQAHFLRLVQHMLVGQLGAPMELLLTANDTEPTVNGVNGAVATAPTTLASVLLPYGNVAYPGGI
ncbi:MAG: hypothetical protein QXL01_02850 [Thermoplasmatales archaeon]